MPKKKLDDLSEIINPETAINLSAVSNKIKPKFSGMADGFEETMQRKAETEMSLTEWSKITTAFKKGLIVRGTVESAMPMEGFGSAVAFVSLYGFSVLIPYDEMIKQSPIKEELPKNVRIKRESNILASMIGANVDLIIKDINQIPETGEYVVIGSRVAAMMQQMKYYFDKDDNEHSRINVGDLVTADVIAVSRGTIILSFYGYDLKLDTFLTTVKYTEGLNLMYSPGDVITMRITSLEYDAKGNLTILHADRREVEKEELIQKNGSKVKLGGFANAYITSISQRSDALTPTYHLYIPSWGVPAVSWYAYINNINKKLCSGDLVLVHVEDFNGKNDAVVTIQRKLKGIYD